MIKKLEIGSRFAGVPVTTINSIIDAVVELQTKIRTGARVQAPRFENQDCGLIQVKNTVGSANQFVPIFGVLGCSDILSKPTSDENEEGEEQSNGAQYQSPVISGVAPTTADHSSKFVILQSSVPKDGVTAGRKLGFTFVKVSVADIEHTHAEVKDSDTTQLQSASSGPCEIWWLEDVPEGEDPPSEAEPRTLWALVLMGGGGGSSTTDLVIGIWQENVLAATSTLSTDRDEGSIRLVSLVGGVGGDLATGQNPMPVGFSEGAVGLFQSFQSGDETKYMFIVPWCGFLEIGVPEEPE